MSVKDREAKAVATAEQETATDTYIYSEEEKKVVSGTFLLFTEALMGRDRTFEYFDGRNLTEYINDSARRWYTNVDIRDDIEDWQSVVHVPFTRNKVNGILGKVIDALPVADYVQRGDEDMTKAEILNSLAEYADNVDDSEEIMVYTLLEGIVKGTAIVYEGVDTFTRMVRDVTRTGPNGELTISEKSIRIRKLKSSIISLEEFYPSSVGIRKISDMPWCFTRKEVSYDKFCMDYRNYPKYDKVKPYTSLGNHAPVDMPEYLDYITQATGPGNVEILDYWNQVTDEHILIANGIWLNPLQGDKVSPIPFSHKKLPFWSIKYDIFGHDFFYGKSLPDKLKSLQDVMNVLQNMLLDQSFLTIFKPILTAGFDDIDDDFLRPGRRISIDTNGLPLNQAYAPLDIGTPSGWHQFILEYTKRILEESSMDSVSQGVAGVGGRTTATEIRSAAAGVISLIGLFAKFIKFGAKDRARLRGANILQYYTDPSIPIAEAVLGKGGGAKMSKAFATVQIESLAMTPGARGLKVIEIFKNENDLPTKNQQKIKKTIGQLRSGKKISRWAVTADYIRNFEFDVSLIPNPKSEASRDIDRALEVQFQQTMNALYPDLIDRTELAAQLVEKYGRDPAKVLKPEVLNPPPPQQQKMPGQDSMMPGPGGDNSANTVKGATEVGGEGNAMKDLMSSMQG